MRAPQSQDHWGCFKRQREGWELLQPSGQRAGGAQGEGPTGPGSSCGLTRDPSGWHCARVREGPGGRSQGREAGPTARPAQSTCSRSRKAGDACRPAPENILTGSQRKGSPGARGPEPAPRAGATAGTGDGTLRDAVWEGCGHEAGGDWEGFWPAQAWPAATGDVKLDPSV